MATSSWRCLAGVVELDDGWPTKGHADPRRRYAWLLKPGVLLTTTRPIRARGIVKDEDGIDLAADDFRRVRRYLAPWLFAGGEEGTTYPPPDDLMPEEPWDSVMVLPTDVALKTSSYAGATAARLAALHTGGA